MKHFHIITITAAPCLFTLSALTSHAQVYTPPPATNQSQTASADSGNTTIVNQKKETQSPYGNEVPFIDPTQETISIMGHTFNLGDNRLGGQFEAYLADTPNTSKNALEYRKTIDAILEAVSPHTTGVSVNDKLKNGFALLPKASSYSGDGKICDSLSNAIYAAMLSKGAIANTKAYINELEKEKQRLIRNGDLTGTASISTQTTSQDNKGKKQTTVQKAAESLESQDIQKRIKEIEILQKAQTTKGNGTAYQARIHYQALLAQLFVQRRFEHVVIGTRFYSLIFRGGNNKLNLKKESETAKFFAEGLGVEPTVSGLDSAANEAMRKVSTLVAAFNNHISHNELHNGAKRLTEAYALGEYLPEVQSVPAEDRRKILEYVRDGHALVKSMDVHDYEQAQIYLDALKARSADFDSTKAEGAIRAYTRVSNSHIRAAQIALAKGDDVKFEQELKSATQVWPTNPKLNEIDKRLDNLLEKGDTAKTLLDDFDRLLSEQNYREIFKRQYEFAPVTVNDPARQDGLEQIIKNIQRIDFTLFNSKEISKLGNDFAAWEALATIQEEFPKDPELMGEIMKLSSKVANFTVALNNAKEFENNDLNPQTGSALTWYLEAKSIYPDSKHAQEGIDRIIEKILP
ncbi:MAG: hypothetical protein ACSHX0_10690 [Akkermansiaceae bacterium]